MSVNSIETQDQRGFTIIELMIALTILSIMLIISTLVLAQVGKIYSKGVNSSDLQNATQGIVNSIASDIQFSGDNGAPAACYPVTPLGTNYVGCAAPDPTNPSQPSSANVGAGTTAMTVYAYCFGTIRFTFTLGREEGIDNSSGTTLDTPNVLVRDQMAQNNDPCVPLDLSQSAPTDVYTSGNGYEMLGNHMSLTDFSVTYIADNIYFINIGTAYGDEDLQVYGGTPGHYSCNGSATQYCATSFVSESVSRRLQ